jgi:hypothetical protein
MSLQHGRSVSASVRPAVRSAVRLLLDAYERAREHQRSPWDFAVEIKELHACKLTDTDLRDLLCNKLIDHRVEIKPGEPDARSFRSIGGYTFRDDTCLILTDSGAAWARSLNGRHLGNGSSPDRFGKNGIALATTPTYDLDLRQLRIGGHIAKQLRQKAECQEQILDAFQEQNWPRRIANPLSLAPGCDPKQHLRQAISNLNHHQKRPCVRFHADGTGDGVLWEIER